ncbi:MAG: DUF1572 family protein [Chitinophagaceae bacterium]
MASLGKDYLQTAIRRFKYYKDLGDKTFEQLNEWDFHYRPNDASNSIATIIRHLAGNMLSRWTNFLEEDGEKEWRHRDQEFEIVEQSKEELLDNWSKGWDRLLSSLASLSKKDLKKMVLIRGEKLSAVDAINRQLAHYPYHIGQIIYIAKTIKNKNWKNLSIPPGESEAFNDSAGPKDPARSY